jgi:hypothetical protein
VLIDPQLQDEVPDQRQTVERIACKHNATQSEDCPTYRGRRSDGPAWRLSEACVGETSADGLRSHVQRLHHVREADSCL